MKKVLNKIMTWSSVVLLVSTMAVRTDARPPLDFVPTPAADVSVRAGDCAQGKSFFDMDINNVRARLLSSGDVWWDLANPKYEVPKVQPGQKPVHAIFAGGIWLGGKDPAGNLKVAVTTYRSGTATDFWPGPLRETSGTTNDDICKKWDKQFVVTGKEIEAHLRLFRAAKAAGQTAYDPSLIPAGLKGWPAYKNPYFFTIHAFDMEDRPASKARGWGKFHDEDNNGKYDPKFGDFPIIDVRGCEQEPIYPDQMTFWIYNDAGGTHTRSSRSIPIQMEVQVQAFAYATNDELNDMTFQRYKLINRATQDIKESYFAMWVDPDLGCPDDDYIGCDTSRSMMYIYNSDEVDGINDCNCGSSNTYCRKIPLLGVDYFRGPRDEFGNELGMSSFTYYARTGSPVPGGMQEPTTAPEFYNLLTGKWKDGTTITGTGLGYNPGATNLIKYAFPSAPNERRPLSWSMSAGGLPAFDMRSIQATGAFLLKPGAINELIIGVPFVADQKYPSPDISRLQEADDIAQALFDNCFKLPNGPDAPDVTWVELNNEVIAVLSNDSITSNNYKEGYKERGLRIPKNTRDSNYRFQGYLIYQLANPTVSLADVVVKNDPTKARLVAQVDVQDTITKIVNWKTVEDPTRTNNFVFVPEVKIQGKNEGIKHTFRLSTDAFGSTGSPLVNQKKYYYTVVSYAFNNYKPFDPNIANGGVRGNAEPFFVGRRNIGSPLDGKHFYTVIPRPITQVSLNAAYGEGNVQITRTDGVGNQSKFLDLSDATLDEILKGTNTGKLTYKPGAGPIEVKIYNPLEVKDGEYEVALDGQLDANNVLIANTSKWTLKNLANRAEVIASDTTLNSLNEQLVAKYGFSISIGQVDEPGVRPLANTKNGAVGERVVYGEGVKTWLAAQPNGGFLYPILGTPTDLWRFIKLDKSEIDNALDPNKSLANLSNLFRPYVLCRWDVANPSDFGISPAWQNINGQNVRVTPPNTFAGLNNVDIVFTSDKSKWSRCIVVETANAYHTQGGFTTEGNKKNFDIRSAPSVSRDALPNNANKAAGEVLAAEQAAGYTTGMGWFPGYAVDVETGERVNIFFGENSIFSDDPTVLSLGTFNNDSKGIGRDMIWNPSSQVIVEPSASAPRDERVLTFTGGQHHVYVTNTKYDGCLSLRDRLSRGSDIAKLPGFRTLTWTMASPFLTSGQSMKSYKDGLIPGDLKVKLRVDNAFANRVGTNVRTGLPTYNFKLENVGKKELATKAQFDSMLNKVNIVPNPFYVNSGYEATELETTVYITNLPDKCNVTIMSIDGRFIREFKSDQIQSANKTGTGVVSKQTSSFIPWDVKNSTGIPVASGVYLIQVDAFEKGQRTLKSMIINREFDPSKL
ncbi:MAG: hypothetical protein RL757_640 [Bacteroidota bacterium]|jgi:hypothetical protein